jgi:uncharacterized peroxidase-related enzyme
MSFFPSLPDNAHAAHLFMKYPHIYKLYTMASRAIMRGPSPLSFQQREMIGAFVSALNDCAFCYGAHKHTAELFGMEEELLTKLIDDIDTAPVDPKEKPLLHFAKKLTLTPARMIEADAQSVFDAGWDEDALHSVIAVTCTFNFMNRIAPGMGIDTSTLDFEILGKERHNTDWTAMVPIEASKMASTLEEAINIAPPNWGEIWKELP